MTGFQRVGVSGRPADELASVAGEALDRAEPVVAVVDAFTEARIRSRLGTRSAAVTFRPPAAVYGGYSAQSAAVSRARDLARLVERGRCTCVERHRPWGRGAPSGTYWLELTAALDLALAELPVTLVCGLGPERPGERLPAAADHPFLRAEGLVVPNPCHRARDLAGLAFDPPPPLGRARFTLPFDAVRLRGLRARLGNWASLAGLGAERREVFVLAVSEVATNSIEHGGGAGTVSGWQTAGELIVEVADWGRISDPLQGLRRPDPLQARGRGLWLARQSCPLVHVWRGSGGTRVRLAVPRRPVQRI